MSTSAWWLSLGAMISPDTPGSGWVLPHNIIYNITHNHMLRCSTALTKHRLLVFMGGPIKFNQIKIKQQSNTREFMKKHSICADMSCSTMWWENLRGSEVLGDILRSQLIASYKTNNNIDLTKMMQKKYRSDQDVQREEWEESQTRLPSRLWQPVRSFLRAGVIEVKNKNNNNVKSSNSKNDNIPYSL